MDQLVYYFLTQLNGFFCVVGAVVVVGIYRTILVFAVSKAPTQAASNFRSSFFLSD